MTANSRSTRSFQITVSSRNYSRCPVWPPTQIFLEEDCVRSPKNRNLSKPRRQRQRLRQRERRQTKGLMRKTIALYVRYKSLFISKPFSAKQQREMTTFCVFRRTQASTANTLNFLMELIACITYLILAGFQTDLRSEQVQLLTKFRE